MTTLKVAERLGLCPVESVLPYLVGANRRTFCGHASTDGNSLATRPDRAQERRQGAGFRIGDGQWRARATHLSRAGDGGCASLSYLLGATAVVERLLQLRPLAKLS
jgi:hypothetical protein